MARRVKIGRHDGLAWLTLPARDADGAPAGFDPQLRASLQNALSLVASSPEVRGIVLQGDAHGWPCASDPLADYEHDDNAPDLSALSAAVAAVEIPVLALLSGRVQSGAMAIAQAAALRIASEDTVFAAPEGTLGVLPAAGGFVRLARRRGGAAALTLMASPEEIGAQAGHAMGLCDLVISDIAPEYATAALDILIEEGVPRDDGALDDPAAYLAALTGPKAALAEDWPDSVARRAVEVVEAALLLPLEEALAFEAVAFDDLRAAPLSRALCHAHRARRAAARLPGEPVQAAPPPARRIGLWNQRPSLAARLLAAGHEVVFGASDAAQIEEAFSSIARSQERAVQSGTLEVAQRDADWARLGAALDLSGLTGAALIIARDVDGALPQADVVLREAEGPARPEGREVTLISNPGLLELVPGPDLDADTLYDIAAVLRQAGATVVKSGPGRAGIYEHVIVGALAAVDRCLLAGLSVAEMDVIMEEAGFTQAPMRLVDELGAVSMLERTCRAGLKPDLLLATIAEAGLRIYDGQEGADSWLAPLRTEAGRVARRIGAAEFLARVHAELANVGATLLQNGQAFRASDIDLALIRALDYPKELGGPMFAADEAGLLATRKRLRALVAEGAPDPVTLWDVLIRNGKRFADLDEG
ncbi:hypothetical protein FGG78_14790 [Thioclava sp. BHET1]|nr:hypothetical protein FGG78_14790 [Thioclava sp. BHET1]